MTLNYSISVKNNLLMQGINVVISAEFAQGTLPKCLIVNVSGPVVKKDHPDSYMSLNATYNIAGGSFMNCNGTNVPGDFVAEIETAILETYEQLKTEQEVKA